MIKKSKMNKKMGFESFLDNDIYLEDSLRRQGYITIDHTIVKKEHVEKVKSALSFRKIKYMNEEIISNTNFKYELGDVVKKSKEVTIEDAADFIVVGRVNWAGYENDYIVCPIGQAHNKETYKQFPESLLAKSKENEKR